MRVTFANKEEDIFLDIDKPSYSILQILWLNNLYNTHALCANVGKCGRCKVEFLSTPPSPTKDEISILNQEEIDTGIRLSCKHSAKDDYHIKIFDYSMSHNSEKVPLSAENIENKKNKKAMLAIDFGTTNIEYSIIFDSQDFLKAKSTTIINPMMGIGSEIMSRLHFAMEKENAASIKNRVCATIQSIVEKESEKFDIEKIIFSANSAMIYLTLGHDTKCLASSPYSLDYKGDSIENISYKQDDFEKKLPPMYIPPLLAPFIGGDISSGLLALEDRKNEYPYMFIDMGTNAEFVLALGENISYMASVPLGPSVEGVGLSQGIMAKERGAVIDFDLNADGIRPIFIDENNSDTIEAEGMSGTAYIQLLKILINIGLLDSEGHFINDPKLPLAKKLAQFYTQGKPAIECLKISKNLYISSNDIESILKVKAAFRTSFDILVKESGINADSIKKIYLAGAFGRHIKPISLIDLGFLPQFLHDTIEQLGNTSLLGAIKLCDNEKQEEMKEKFQHIKHIDLANHANFAEYYMNNFTFNKE